jgi:hypothetical protein
MSWRPWRLGGSLSSSTVEGTLRGYALRDGVLVDAYTMARLTEPAALAG